MANPEVITPQRYFDPHSIGRSIDLTLPLDGVNLRSYFRGETESRRYGQGSVVYSIREYRDGEDSRRINHIRTAADPEERTLANTTYADISPTVVIATDILKNRYGDNDGLVSERLLGLSAIMCILTNACKENLPMQLVAVSDDKYEMDRLPAFNEGQLRAVAKKLSWPEIKNQEAKPKSDSDEPKKSLLAKFKLRRKADAQPDPEEEQAYLTLADLLKKVGRLGIVESSLLVVVSDGRDYDPDEPKTNWRKPLLSLFNNYGNQVVFVELLNPWDTKLPDNANVFDVKGKQEWLGGAAAEATAQNYSQGSPDRQKLIDRSLGSPGLRHLKLKTDDPKWRNSLVRQFKRISESHAG